MNILLYNGLYFVICKCGNKRTYTIKNNAKSSIRNNSLCRYCANKGKVPWNKGLKGYRSGNKHPFYGKHRSDKDKEKISKNTSIAMIKYCSDPDVRKKMSIITTKRYLDPRERAQTSKTVKRAIHKPNVRKKHLDALYQSKWIKVRTDKGQLELLEKWNKLGFNFDPNFQIHTDLDLFYVDGYDKEKNVVMEYDSKYHQKTSQKQKDLIRQNKIINILKPKKFWRFDAINKQFRNVLERSS